MQFKEYKKIHGLHKEETEGILQGTCYIQEKLDGANASIWLGDDGNIHYGSRSRDLYLAGDNFNGFGDWVKANEDKLRLFLHCGSLKLRMNGEWLVRHTIGYNELSYKKFYLFDVESTDETGFTTIIQFPLMYERATMCNIPTAQMFATIDNPTLEQIKEFAGKSEHGPKGEGVVIKNLNFVNKFGDKQFGKFVTQEFKEDNAVTFGGNNKTSESYHEMYYVNKFMTLPRVMKVFHKIEAQEGRLSEKHIPRIMGTCFHDLMAEEGYTIAEEMSKGNTPFNFKAFKGLCNKKSKSIFLELLTGDISVAHQ